METNAPLSFPNNLGINGFLIHGAAKDLLHIANAAISDECARNRSDSCRAALANPGDVPLSLLLLGSPEPLQLEQVVCAGDQVLIAINHLQARSSQ
jgi:hypothetical protein